MKFGIDFAIAIMRFRLYIPTLLLVSLLFILEYGVDNKDLVKDILALKSSEELIRSRLSKATEHGVTPLKPWMVRCPDDVFHR